MTQYKRYTITAALPYVNGHKHIGHLAGAYLPSDVYARYLRLMNRDVVFVCGSDELGTPITIQALKENLSNQELVDKYHQISKEVFEKLDISFDIYYRTSDPLHIETAQEFFLKFYQEGKFQEVETMQYYDESMDMFLADRYIQGICPNCQSDKAYGDQCESCGKSLDPTDLINPKSTVSGNTPILKSTKNWYLPLDNYEEFLQKWLIEGKKSNWKSNTYGQAKSWIDSGLQPRSMTRDGKWGVPVPLEGYPDKILYVWFDAPIGYISATKKWASDKGVDWKPYWQSEDTKLVHFIGKDNIVFHTIIFPVMLHAHGDFILPTDVPANEFLNLEGKKMSTSRAWSLEMTEYLNDFPEQTDELRYMLLSVLPEQKDSDFSWQDFQLKVNSELVAIVGNLVNRVTVLLFKYYSGEVKFHKSCSELQGFLKTQKEKISQAIEDYKFREALTELIQIARHGNKLLTENEPWKLIKTDPEKTQIVLYDCLELILNFGILAQPFLPKSAQKIFSMFHLVAPISWDEVGNENLIKSNLIIAPTALLFNKIEDNIIEAQILKLNAKTQSIMANENSKNQIQEDLTINSKPEVSYEDFDKLNLVIGTVKAIEKVEKTDKLLKLSVAISGEIRTIVSGIALHFTAEDLLEKQVLVLENLAPRKIRGIESQGMLLFAEDQGKLIRIAPTDSVSNGSSVS
ncbi:MAG: methionine--tRNA ligase [Chitinophagales bacterium]|nr:methionine--tRNA ligase [Chitinophagales bacterium]